MMSGFWGRAPARIGSRSRGACACSCNSSFSIFEKPSQHVTDMILPAEEHCEDTHRLPIIVDVEPVNRPSDGEMPQAGRRSSWHLPR